jgi:hypothetical protein
MTEPPGRFAPLRPPSRSRLVVLYLVGPLLWVAALVVLSVVLRVRDAVEIALLITAVSFAAAFVLLVPQRAQRVRRENERASPR